MKKLDKKHGLTWNKRLKFDLGRVKTPVGLPSTFLDQLVEYERTPKSFILKHNDIQKLFITSQPVYNPVRRDRMDNLA